MNTMNQDKKDETTALPVPTIPDLSIVMPPSQRQKELTTFTCTLMAGAQRHLDQVEKSLVEQQQQEEGPPREYPTFASSEIVRGPLLGAGGFGVVYAVKNFMLNVDCDDEHQATALVVVNHKNSSSTLSQVPPRDGVSSCQPASDTDKDDSDGQSTESSSDNSTITPRHDESHHGVQSARNLMATMTSRYAIKQVHPHLGAVDRIGGMVDLAKEVKYLSILRHPNIVKISGYAKGPIDPNFFIIMDRLYEILDAKLKSWAQIENSHRGPCLLEWGRGNKQRSRELLVERLTVAYDLADAFSYMHKKKLVYRDIKPENIGFDIKGDVKIFDFGLCKVLSPSLKAKGRDGNEEYGYRLTGDTGSIPYMAPEVAIHLPYDTKCDVFSFSILLWEILSLKQAFQKYTRQDFLLHVVRDRERLWIQRKWPPLTRQALKEAWKHDPQKRPDMKRVASLLRGDLNALSSDPAVMNRTAHKTRDRSCEFQDI